MSQTTSTTKETYRLAFPDFPNAPYTHVAHGLPFDESCAHHAASNFHAERVYLIVSTSLSKHTKYVRSLEKALGKRWVGTWIGIRPHTPWEDLVPIINDMRAKKADLLVTLGGGSLTDGAKVIVYAVENELTTIDELEDFVDNGNWSRSKDGNEGSVTKEWKAPKIPFICIPTTLSGGEYSNLAGSTNNKTHEKVGIKLPKMYCSLVILDPALCTSTPEWVWLSTGVRAIDHAVESICGTNPPDPVVQESTKALSLLVPNLLKTKADPSDLEARLQCQLAANYVMMMMPFYPGQILVGGSHGIGHQLGPLGVGHGETSCVLLPSVMKYNKPVNEQQQNVVKEILWSDATVSKDVLEKVGLRKESSDAGDALDAIFRALGMPRSLKEVGVGRDKLDLVAGNSLKDPCCVVNPIPLQRKEQVLEILETLIGSEPKRLSSEKVGVKVNKAL